MCLKLLEVHNTSGKEYIDPLHLFCNNSPDRVCVLFSEIIPTLRTYLSNICFTRDMHFIAVTEELTVALCAVIRSLTQIVIFCI